MGIDAYSLVARSRKVCSWTKFQNPNRSFAVWEAAEQVLVQSKIPILVQLLHVNMELWILTDCGNN